MPGTVDNKLIYHLGVLIPFWVLELLCEIIVVIGGAIGLAGWVYYVDSIVCEYDIYGDYECDGGYAPDQSVLYLGYGAFGLALGLGVLFVILHIIQIALFGRRKLTPAANFGIELSRLVTWLAVMILEIVALLYGASSILAMAFSVAVWVLYLGSTIYSIVIFDRARRGEYNGSSAYSAYPTASAAGHPARETQQATAQPQHHGLGPYQAQGAQQHYGPGPYQQPNHMYQQNQYQQPNQYHQPNQYIQPDYASTHIPVSPVGSPVPTYNQPTYPPAQQQEMPEKELATQRYH